MDLASVNFSLIGRNMENQPTKCTIFLEYWQRTERELLPVRELTLINQLVTCVQSGPCDTKTLCSLLVRESSCLTSGWKQHQPWHQMYYQARPFLWVHHHHISKISPWLLAPILISVPLLLSFIRVNLIILVLRLYPTKRINVFLP